ncbi:peptidoglycan DD-metalloendopeptidase family protein [Jatrophihabitans sp. YIM 134969]
MDGRRWWHGAVALLTLLVVWASPAAALSANPPVVTYRAPVAGPLVVLRGFDDVGPYAPGHRGVDLRAGPGGAVLAAGAGVVTFAGPVAGRGVVTVLHADGVRTSYEPLTPAVAAGAVVAAGTVLGRLEGAHGSFPAGAVLHWGARLGERYLDPLTLLAPLGPVRLLPWDDP